jgi:hypothetical protein
MDERELTHWLDALRTGFRLHLSPLALRDSRSISAFHVDVETSNKER